LGSVEQSLYFDRYLKILAPGMDVMTDERLSGIATMNDVKADAGSGSPDSVIIDV
jgi:hypothetical protein